MFPFTHETDTSSIPYKNATTPVNHSSLPSTSTTTTFSREKEGPRKKDEGINDTQTQGIISVESDNTGGTILRITLLAAGFIIGPGGATIRDISTRFKVDIRSSNQTFQSCKVRSLHITAPNDHQAVQAACSVIAQGVDHYNSLTGGVYVNCYVDREQVVGGITFYYSPPPKHAVAHAAMLITPHPKANSLPSPASPYSNHDKNPHSSSSSCSSKAKMATIPTPPPPTPTTTTTTATPSTPAALSSHQYGYATPSPASMSPHTPSSPRTASNSGANTPINIEQTAHKIRANSALSRTSTITTSVYAPSFTDNNQASDFGHYHRHSNILDCESITKEEEQQGGYGEEHQEQLVSSSSSPHFLPSITTATTPPTQPALVILPVIMDTSLSSTNQAASVMQSVIQALKGTFPDAAIWNPYHSNTSASNAATATSAAETIISNTFSVLTVNDKNKEKNDDNSDDDVFAHSPLRSVLNTLGFSPSKPHSEQPAEEGKNKRESHHHQLQQQLQYPDHHHHRHHHHQDVSLHPGKEPSPQYTATTHLDRRVCHQIVGGGGHFSTAGHGHGTYDDNEGEVEGEWTATPCPSSMVSPCRTEDNGRGRGDEAVLSKYGFPSYGQFARQNPFYSPQF